MIQLTLENDDKMSHPFFRFHKSPSSIGPYIFLFERPNEQPFRPSNMLARLKKIRKKYTEGPSTCHRVTKSSPNRKARYNTSINLQNQCKLRPSAVLTPVLSNVAVDSAWDPRWPHTSGDHVCHHLSFSFAIHVRVVHVRVGAHSKQSRPSAFLIVRGALAATETTILVPTPMYSSASSHSNLESIAKSNPHPTPPTNKALYIKTLFKHTKFCIYEFQTS